MEEKKSRRQEIIEKEMLTASDFAELLGIGIDSARTIMQEIKLFNKPRIDIRGYIHINDYIDYYKLDIKRFLPNKVLNIK